MLRKTGSFCNIQNCRPIGNNKRLVMYNYCDKSMHGSVTRLKQQLARLIGDVISCGRGQLAITANTLSIIYELMDMAKLAIEATVKH